MANSILNHERVLESIYCAIDEVNQQLSEERRIDKSANTVLLGESGNLDSLALISLIVTVEQEIEKEFHVTINLTDHEDALFEKNSPLRTIAALVRYISKLLEAQSNA